MNRLKSSIKKLWWKPYSWVRGENVIQTRDQTITHLLWFYLFSVSLAFLSAVIQIQGIPAEWGISGPAKESLGPLAAAIAVKLSYDFIRDVIATEFDAAAKDIEKEVEGRFSEEMQEAHEKANGLPTKHDLDLKYLAYVKPIIGADELKLQGVSPKLIEKRGKNSRAFVDELDKEFEDHKIIREVRYIIHNLTDDFLHQLAVKGVAEVLHLKIEDVYKRTECGKDLYLLYIDIYAYLSAWLICSIDNDRGSLMPIGCIGMRYTGEGSTPDKETYKNIIQAIGKIVEEDRYIMYTDYPASNPLESKSVKDTIINYLGWLIDLIEKYPLEVVKS
jgi:hypothetical protein